MEEIDIRIRIKQILAENGLNPTQLSKMFNVNQKKLNNQINGNTHIAVSTIVLILKAVPDLSTEWLLRGTGEQFINNSESSENKYFEMCKLLFENRKKDAELYLKLADLVNKEQYK